MILAARGEPYDLVSLDINLGHSGNEGPQQDGLHLLGEIARTHTAWMVAILTGVEKDPSFKGGRATVVQRNLRNLAMQTFPPERLVVIEKPSELTAITETALPAALADSLVLGNRIKQVVSIFEHTSSYRNIFRRLILPNQFKGDAKEEEDGDAFDFDTDAEADDKPKRQKKEWRKGVVVHWQIRYDCGELITVPEKTGMDVIRVLLENEHKEFKYAELEAKVEGGAAPGAADGGAAVEVIFGGAGHEQVGIPEDADVETRRQYIAQIRMLKGKIEQLENESGDPRDLAKAKSDIKAFRDAVKKLRQAPDTQEAQRIRAHKSRILASLREQGLVDFADHLENWIRSDRGSIAYWPPSDMNWQTE